MTTVDEILNYYQSLKEILKSEMPKLTFNKDRGHNSAVLRLMFETSSEISMYCGQLSVLRKEFYEHIKNDSPELSEILSKSIIDSFNQFLSKENASLTVIFEDYKEEFLKDLLDPISFSKGRKEKKIKLYKLNDELTIKKRMNHFSISNNQIARIEQDKDFHNAICAFNREDITNNLNEIYGRLLAIAEPISLN